MTTSALAIEVRGLCKTYGSVEAVRDVDLEVQTGEVFALIGPNGAGKTTIVEILEGYRDRTSGHVSVLGADPASEELRLKQRVGIVLQDTAVEPYLTTEEVVELFRGYYPQPRPLDEVLALVGLEEQRKIRVRRLSGGQQRRLDVAIGLAGDPELLFLDEPTTGFDPSARRDAWHMINSLRQLGKTVFLTTHYLDEAQHLADHVAVMSAGQIVARGTPHELIGRSGATRISFQVGSEQPVLPADLHKSATRSNGRISIETRDPTRDLHTLTTWALEQRRELEELSVARRTLEDVYLELTASDQREATS